MGSALELVVNTCWNAFSTALMGSCRDSSHFQVLCMFSAFAICQFSRAAAYALRYPHIQMTREPYITDAGVVFHKKGY